MKKYRIPYSIVIDGEFEAPAETVAKANIRARAWLSKQGKEVHKALMEAGVGRIRIHSDQIIEVTPDKELTTYGPGGFEKEDI